MASTIAMGLTFGVIQEFYLRTCQKLPVSEKEFYQIQSRFIPYIASYVLPPRLAFLVASSGGDSLAAALTCVSCRVRNLILDLASIKRQQSNANVTITVDGRWSSRRQAMEGTVPCFDAHTREILDVQHIGEVIKQF